MSKKIIKELGLEKEFSNWLKNIHKEFKYGDRVELIEPRLYGSIQKGEYGTVHSIRKSGDKTILSVEFDEKPGSTYNWFSSRFRLIR